MFFLSRSKIVIISVLLACTFTTLFCLSALKNNPVGKAEYSDVKILLDAGHGGIDGGVVGTYSKVKESKLNLSVVKKLEKIFFSAGFDVVLTRSTDAGLYGVATSSRKKKDMLKRKEIILESNPTLVISIHMNKFSSANRSGGQVFFKENDEKSKLLASLIQTNLNLISISKRDFSPLQGDYYILNCSNIPSVICECGFLSNREEEMLLITDEYQHKLAQSIFDAVIKYLSLI